MCKDSFVSQYYIENAIYCIIWRYRDIAIIRIQGGFFTGTPQFQYQKENRQLANHSCCSSKSCYLDRPWLAVRRFSCWYWVSYFGSFGPWVLHGQGPCPTFGYCVILAFKRVCAPFGLRVLLFFTCPRWPVSHSDSELFWRMIMPCVALVQAGITPEDWYVPAQKKEPWHWNG